MSIVHSKSVAAAVAALLLTGCANLKVMSHVPLSTIARLTTMKLSDIDPSQLRIGARLPVDLEPRPLGVKVRMTLSRNGAPPRTEDFVLVAVDEEAESLVRKRFQRADARLWFYALSERDVTRLNTIMSERDHVARKEAVSLSIAVGVDACRRATIDGRALPTSTYLRTNRADYIVLVEDLDLRSVGETADLMTRVPLCR